MKLDLLKYKATAVDTKWYDLERSHGLPLLQRKDLLAV